MLRDHATKPRDDRPVDDPAIVFPGMMWAGYKSHLTAPGDRGDREPQRP